MDEGLGVLIRLGERDNVAIARADISKGQMLEESRLVTRDDMPRGHKIALRDLAPGEIVIKYGQVIGAASLAIHAGDHVHLHNLVMHESRRTAEAYRTNSIDPHLPVSERQTFEGYLRRDGRVGTRNYIVIISSVNCSATVA